jgi:putative aminopeptidase FrvX
MEDFVRLLKMLSEARGPSGFEDEVREVVIKEMEPYVDEVVVDRWGNVIGVKRGSSDYRAMVAAHMDEIGLIVDYIDKDGFLRIRPIGGWSEVTLAGQRVWVRAADGRWVRGVVGVTPPHVTPSGKEREAPEIKDMYVDVGLGAGRRWRGWASPWAPWRCWIGSLPCLTGASSQARPLTTEWAWRSCCTPLGSWRRCP